MARELIDTESDKRFVRRNKDGRFSQVVDVGRSLAADQRFGAKAKARKATATGAADDLYIR
jgi:hypothetical protein